MGRVILLVLLIVIIIFNVIIAGIMDEVATLKGYEESVFWKCFWLGLAGWLYVVALPDLKTRENQEKIIKYFENDKEETNTATIFENEELPLL